MTLFLLVAGLVTLTVTLDNGGNNIRSVASIAHLHHGVTAPSQIRLLTATGHEMHQLDDGILAAILLMGASFGVLVRTCLRDARPRRVTIGRPLNRGPPTHF
ncbi:MAG: hypothetical protein M3Y42_13205 [Actinomycetota bacterium]|nr:hypothetical protein [Actinomycetota bacterium]MDQ2957912.1 hypothetical protein [Actinomycetota bacterium]